MIVLSVTTMLLFDFLWEWCKIGSLNKKFVISTINTWK